MLCDFRVTQERWRPRSTLSRILKDEEYTGKYLWNRSTHVKDPLSGKRKKVERAKDEWITQDRPEMRIISDEGWAAAKKRWSEIDRALPIRRAKQSPPRQMRSYVEANPTHLLSGTLKCGTCGGAMALVSGKGNGYYGCLNGSRRSCEQPGAHRAQASRG